MAEATPGGAATNSAGTHVRMFGNGALASCIAEAATLPLEVTKMRLQLQKNNKDPLRSPRYNGMVDAFQNIVRQEKWHSLFKGLEAGMHKQILYTGLRLGLYDHLTNAGGEDDPSIPTKIACAGLTTGIGIIIANPADVVQTKYIAWRQVPPPDPLRSRMAAASTAAAPASTRSTIFASRAAGSEPAPPSASGGSKATAPGLDSRNGSSYHTRAFSYSTHAPWGQVHQHAYRAQSQQSVLALRSHARRMHGEAGVRVVRFLSGATYRVCVHGAVLGGRRRFGKEVNAHGESDALAGPHTITGVPLRNARRAYYIIVREEGLLGLYRGFWANFACSCVQGATEIACYDVTKNMFLSRGAEDGMPVHLAAGMCAGLLSTLLSNPFDVVATRMMAAKKASAVKRSTLEEVLKITRREGVLAFYSGFGPNVLRVGSYNIILWITYEQMRKLTCA